jgi:asparagine synthase (glutamine-hydrolysing)
MCGITGFFSYKNKVNTQKYYNAHLKISHRGPDDEGFIYKNNLGEIEHLSGNDTIIEYISRDRIYSKRESKLILGHRRLSIIDLSFHGHQPFKYQNLYLVYNGELYNYLELRNELIILGYKFITDTDTEVFLKAYHYWGVDAFNKFNGMWAAAIYDKNKDNILLTRDRFGIKPLYYSLIDDNFVFGSEIKFVSSFLDKLYPNEQMVYEYLRFNYLDHTNQTMFRDIKQLEPNTYMEFSQNGIKTYHYWDLEEKSNITQSDVENTLNDSIKLRMRSDVEVGSLLSGGIDSSTILGIINDKKYSEKFQTFSAVFKEKEFSEKKYIDEFETNNIDLKKHFIYPKAEEFTNFINDIIYTQEEPFRSLSVFSQYNVYYYIKNKTNVIVLLNGQGADEIFSGYTSHYYIYLISLAKDLRFFKFFQEIKYLSKNRNISQIKLLFIIFGKIIQKYKKNNYIGEIFVKNFNPTFKDQNRFDSLLKNKLWHDLTFSALREYLRYEDKNSMKFSLESRLPFLDYRLVSQLFSVPDSKKINKGVSKFILRQIAINKIPDKVLNRTDKMGFVSPQELWQKTILNNELDFVFKKIKEKGIFDFLNKDVLFDIYQKYKDNHFDDWVFIWRVYCLYKWKNVWGVDEG